MKKYSYYSPDEDYNPHLEIVSEKEIIETYFYPYWLPEMIKKFGANSELINIENCIEEWQIVHWAEEYHE
jgi:hypothetical protein